MLGQDVRAAARRRATSRSRCRARRARHRRRGRRRRCASRARAPDAGRSTAPRGPNVDGAGVPTGRRRSRSTAPGPGNVARAAAAAGRVDDPRLQRLRVRRRQARAVRRVRPDRAAVGLRPLEARRRARGRARRRPTAHTIVRSSWLFGAGGPLLPEDDPAARGRARRARGRRRPGRLPDVHRAPRAGAGAARRRRRRSGVAARRLRAGSARGSSSRARSSPRRRRCEVPADHDRPSTRCPRPGPPTACCASERGAPALPTGATACASSCPQTARVRGMKLLVCGGAGFIGSTFVELRVREHGDEVTVLDKLTYAGRRENLRDGRGRDPVRRTARSRIRRRSPRPSSGAEAIVNFAAETHVDRSIADPYAFSVTNGQGTHVLLEAARERGLRYVQVSTDEVYGSIESGSFTESSPLAAVEPVQRDQDRRRPARLAATSTPTGCETLVCRGSNNYGPRQYPEKLIPLMILNALAGDRLPVYGDGRNVRNWLYVEDFGRGIGHVLEHGVPGRGLQLRRPRRVREHRGRQADPRADRRRRVADRVRHRPPRPRPPLLAVLGQAAARSAGSARTRFEEGLERTVDWYRDNALVVGADPLGRLPRVLRAPLRARAEDLR